MHNGAQSVSRPPKKASDILSQKKTQPKLFLPLLARHFLCRALLSCSTMFDACEILSSAAEGDVHHHQAGATHFGGASDGISVNMIFARQEGATLIHNAEVGGYAIYCIFASIF